MHQDTVLFIYGILGVKGLTSCPVWFLRVCKNGQLNIETLETHVLYLGWYRLKILKACL